MATDQSSCSHADDDYIDMEVSSSSNFLSYSIRSPPQSIEFEFQMSSNSHNRESTTSPADELFYKGKLLPLHLPPRLQMVQKLLQSPTSTAFYNKTEDPLEECYAIPFITSSASPSTNVSSQLESCNVSSPSESCRVSRELNPDEFFFEWSTETNRLNGDLPNKSWSKKLKQSSLGQKLKASRAYLKSLFTKSDCTNDSGAKSAGNVGEETSSTGNDSLRKYTKVATKSQTVKTAYERYKLPNTLKRSIEKETLLEDSVCSQRRSFSGAIQWHSTNKSLSSPSTSTSSSGSSSLSSSFSFSSNAICDLQLLKRSSSANSELENSIEGAIAHCKMSQQLYTSRKTASEVGSYSSLASGITAYRDSEKPKECNA